MEFLFALEFTKLLCRIGNPLVQIGLSVVNSARNPRDRNDGSLSADWPRGCGMETFPVHTPLIRGFELAPASLSVPLTGFLTSFWSGAQMPLLNELSGGWLGGGWLVSGDLRLSFWAAINPGMPNCHRGCSIGDNNWAFSLFLLFPQCGDTPRFRFQDTIGNLDIESNGPRIL